MIAHGLLHVSSAADTLSTSEDCEQRNVYKENFRIGASFTTSTSRGNQRSDGGNKWTLMRRN